MSLYASIADLPLQIEGYSLGGLEADVGAFVRRTTVVHLRGAGEEGVGEDVNYVGEDQLAFQAAGAALDLAGETTLDGFSRLLDRFDLDAPPATNPGARLYRRWAFESAALDLALRQSQRSLADALGIEPSPLTFVASMSLGQPSSFEPLRRLLKRAPAARFKLDLASDWTPELMAELSATGVVDTVDYKGHYHNANFSGTTPDPDLYKRAAEAFPTAWLEDPALDPASVEALAGHEQRISWDAPIHSLADFVQKPRPHVQLNVKPSRFGFLSELFRTYDYCRAQGIGMYAGGQFELGPGRGQAQYLASLFHPDAPNDLAPSIYNVAGDGPLPASPLEPAPSKTGFRWD